jgi:recombinational DNA repair protein RecT
VWINDICDDIKSPERIQVKATTEVNDGGVRKFSLMTKKKIKGTEKKVHKVSKSTVDNQFRN